MDPREIDALVQRLVHNPHDQEALAYAHQAGQSDPRAYALLLEKVGTATTDPAFASHWLTESANVWAVTLGDAHRAARALMIAIDRDPTQPAPADRLAELYREKGDTKALVALQERRAKALGPLAQGDDAVRVQLAGVHEDLGRLWAESLQQPRKAIEHYRRAVELDPNAQFSIYSVRELLKAASQFAEAVPFFAAELALTDDPARQLALYQDEAEVRRSAGDLAGATLSARYARSIEGGADVGLKQLVGSLILERVQGSQPLDPGEADEGAQLFLELSETYAGDPSYAFSYAVCAAEIQPENDRAIQLAIFYGGELGRLAEVAPLAAAYLAANPDGPLADEARPVAGQAAPPAAGSAPRAAEPARPASAPTAASQPVARAAPAPQPEPELTPEPDSVDDGPSAVGAASADPERVKKLLDEAEALSRKARKNDAAVKYREVVALDPANDEALTFLQGFLRQARKFQELRDILVAAARAPGVDAERKKSFLREVAGLCETQLRDLDTAIQSWTQLAHLDRTDDGARQQLQRLLERAGKWDDLATFLEQAAEQETDTEARIALEKNLAKIHEQKRKDPVATGEAWARIAALTPDDDGALQTAIKWFEKAERPELAAQVISDNVGAVTDEALRVELLKKLGRMREAAADHGGAGEAFAEAASLDKKLATWADAERCFAAGEAWDQAATAAGEQAGLAGTPRDQAALHAREADYLVRAGDDASAVLRLEQAVDLDPQSDALSSALEDRYTSAGRQEDLATFLARRAEKLGPGPARSALRKRAAALRLNELSDAEGARDLWQKALEDGDDEETLRWLADDAEEGAEHGPAVEYLQRLAKVVTEPAARAAVVLREARLLADGLDDVDAAIERYEWILAEIDAKSLDALRAIVGLAERKADQAGMARALERELTLTEETEGRVALAQRLAELYEGALDDARGAIRVLEIVRDADPEDYDAIGRLSSLSEKVEDWPAVAGYLAKVIEVEGDEEEIGRMTRRLAEILHQKVGKGDEALAVLAEVADQGDEGCRDEYVTLGDLLGWKGVVATKLVEWYEAANPGPLRNEKLRLAFDRFMEVGRDAEAAKVGQEIVRTKGGDRELAEKLEAIAVKLKDLDALGVAQDLLAAGLSGPPRAEEMVRQAEVLAGAGVELSEAVQHGEQALSSVPPAEVEPLLQRLAALVSAESDKIDLYERQVVRCKAPADRLRALARAAQAAAALGNGERARGFFDLALSGSVTEETLASLEDAAAEADGATEGKAVRTLLAEALAAGGQGARDGGKTRGALLRRAAGLAHRELGDVDAAFRWLTESLVVNVDDATMDAIEELAVEAEALDKGQAAFAKALEEVFDGPLVRRLLARRAAFRRDRMEDRVGAAADLKRLHDLAPADMAVVDQLAGLYTELQDWKGMVQLHEDQILRGKDPAARAEVARKVAVIWEERLGDPREAADAWRRVLRLKAQDPEATAGLERAKSGMLKKAEPVAAAAVAVAAVAAVVAEEADAPPAPAEEPAPASGSPTAAEATPDEPPADEAPAADEAPPAEAAAPASEPAPGSGGAAPAEASADEDDDRPTPVPSQPPPAALPAEPDEELTSVGMDAVSAPQAAPALEEDPDGGLDLDEDPDGVTVVGAPAIEAPVEGDVELLEDDG